MLSKKEFQTKQKQKAKEQLQERISSTLDRVNKCLERGCTVIQPMPTDKRIIKEVTKVMEEAGWQCEVTYVEVESVSSTNKPYIANVARLVLS